MIDWQLLATLLACAGWFIYILKYTEAKYKLKLTEAERQRLQEVVNKLRDEQDEADWWKGEEDHE